MERSDEAIIGLNNEDDSDEGMPLTICRSDIAPSQTKRSSCTKCERPQPSACFCEALPTVKLRLLYTYCIILQHPNEAKQHQNRTLPFVEHCLDPKSYLKLVGRRFPSLLAPADFSMTTRAVTDITQTSESSLSFFSVSNTAKKIPTTKDDNKLSYVRCMNSIVHQKTTETWLLSSSDHDGTSVTLTQALHEWEERKQLHKNNNVSNNYPNIIVIALDATWKYANEMDRANIRHGCYPNQCLRRVRLTSVDFHHPLFQQIEQQNGVLVTMQRCNNRFSIRTPPKSKSKATTTNGNDDISNIVHLSTAECLAYVLARIEQNDNIYHTIMKPLDLMVRQWQSHYNNSSES